MERIGDRIRWRRKQLGLTQGELGKLSGLGTATISGLELGTQQGTTKLHKIAEQLKCRIEWLETGELPIEPAMGVRDEPPPPPINKLKIHDVHCSPDGALVGAEWDKIEGDEYRQLAHDFIFGLVAAQARANKLPKATLTPEREVAKNKPRHHKRAER
jgi:transcriptional regulator with XRE-family HTH domain